MTTYSVINNQTGEVMLETDSKRLQAANKVLQAGKGKHSGIAADTLQRLRRAEARLTWRARDRDYPATQRRAYGLVAPRKRGHTVSWQDEIKFWSVIALAGLILGLAV